MIFLRFFNRDLLDRVITDFYALSQQCLTIR